MEHKRYKLYEIGRIVSGATPRTNNPENFGGDIAWITPADLSGYKEKYISHGAKSITQKGYDSCSTQLMPAGTVLFSSRAPIGYVAIAKNPVCTNQGFKSVIPNDNVNSEFLYYQLLYLRKQIQDMGSGTTFKEISAKKLGQVEVVLPKIQIQERIVARIEELFSQLDSGVETLKKIKRQLTVYRQAVLYNAFEGITDSTAMGNLAHMIDPQPSHRTPPEVVGGVPYIGVGDINYVEKYINYSAARKVAPTVLDEHIERYTLHEGNFIMGKIGTIGKPFKVQLPQNYTLSANVILIQPDSEKVMPDFLYWQFSSPLVTKQLTAGATATSQPAFGIKKARLLSIRICGFEKQKEIVQKIEARLSICDSIEQTVEAALQQAEAMRQSILKKSFEKDFT